MQWQGVSDRTYNVLWGTNLLSGLSEIASDLPSTPPENSYTDTVYGVQAAGFYRLEAAIKPLPAP